MPQLYWEILSTSLGKDRLFLSGPRYFNTLHRTNVQSQTYIHIYTHIHTHPTHTFIYIHIYSSYIHTVHIFPRTVQFSFRIFQSPFFIFSHLLIMKRFLWLHIVLLCCRYLVNSEAKQKYVKMNAGKFLVGYILGLPVARFNKYVCMHVL